MQQLDTKKRRRFVYEEKDKQDVAIYAAQYGTTAAIRKFKHRFPNLNESAVRLRPWLKKQRENLKEKKKAKNENIILQAEQARGRPLFLDPELDLSLHSMIVSLHTAGAGINLYVVRYDLMVLVNLNPEKFCNYLNLHVSCSWVRSLYQRMGFSRQAATT